MYPNFKVFLCDILNPINDKSCDFIRKGALVLKKVDSKDKTSEYKLFEYGSEEEILRKYSNKKSLEVIDYQGMLAMPGFFDMHFHWVQDDVRLMGKDSLMEWLSTYTWPYEAKFKDRAYSKSRAERFAIELASVGTVGGAIYASIHGHTVDHALKFFKGDFIVGNVLMTMESPKYLTQTKKNALNLVEKLSSKYNEKYAMTPRFAPTTHPDVMKEGAKIARKNKSFIQTHLSENTGEIDYVMSLYKGMPGFEKIKSYTEIYKKVGVLGKKTIMGHCIHLDKEELKLMRDSQTAIAHCPSSNAPVKELGLGSGLFDFHKMEKNKIRWALASDIGGGPFLSMFDVMRSFVAQNKKAKVSGATYTKALYRATLAGAEILGLAKKNGSLDKGKFANFILVESPRKRAGETGEDVLRKVVESCKKDRAAYDGLVKRTFLKGECIFERE